MITPEIPRDESERLESLHDTGLLDSASEERFDRVTRLARRLFDVPIALVSLVDANRQWFKSRQGLDAVQTPRDVSFCGHTILSDEPLIVSNALDDERFFDNPLVTDAPNIRFYAGQPIKVPNGMRIGTLCLIDEEPHEFSDDDIALLRDLGDMVEDQLGAVQMATVDELTGICNRRGFNMLAEKALAMARRNDHEMTQLSFDLNDFKEINDRDGHAAGDQALVDFAQCLVECFRDCDVIARTGGDEFQVLLSNAPARVAPELLNRFQDSISAHNHRAERSYRLSYSVGVANCSAQSSNCLDYLAEQSDQAMYIQKRCKLRSADSSGFMVEMFHDRQSPVLDTLLSPTEITGLRPGREKTPGDSVKQ